MTAKLYAELAALILARLNCITSGNTEWKLRHEVRICELVFQHMPSGAGWDNGTKIDLDASHSDKLVFFGSFHHMNANGFYDGWTFHKITVTPSFAFKFHIRISGSNRNEIKDYLHDLFSVALETEVNSTEGR